MSAALTITATVSILASAPIIVRVRREYVRDTVLSEPTVIAVWVLYTLIVAVAIASAVAGTWELGLSRAVALPIGLGLAGAGAGFAGWGLASMASVRRMSGMQPDELITRGAFRLSRNPQNVGMNVALVGAGIAGSSGLTLAIAAAFAAIFRVYVVYEERHLERMFGDRYRRYRVQTPRVLGLPGER